MAPAPGSQQKRSQNGLYCNRMFIRCKYANIRRMYSVCNERQYRCRPVCIRWEYKGRHGKVYQLHEIACIRTSSVCISQYITVYFTGSSDIRCDRQKCAQGGVLLIRSTEAVGLLKDSSLSLYCCPVGHYLCAGCICFARLIFRPRNILFVLTTQSSSEYQYFETVAHPSGGWVQARSQSCALRGNGKQNLPKQGLLLNWLTTSKTVNGPVRYYIYKIF